MPSGIELAVLEMGYAFEMLRYWVHYQWFLADAEREFPAWLETHAGSVKHGLAVLSDDEALPGEEATAAGHDFDAAWSDYKQRWLGEEHRKQIRFLVASDPECIPPDWIRSNSPLTWSCWSQASESLWKMAAGLPGELAISFRAGSLCA